MCRNASAVGDATLVNECAMIQISAVVTILAANGRKTDTNNAVPAISALRPACPRAHVPRRFDTREPAEHYPALIRESCVWRPIRLSDPLFSDPYPSLRPSIVLLQFQTRQTSERCRLLPGSLTPRRYRDAVYPPEESSDRRLQPAESDRLLVALPGTRVRRP